MDDAELMRRMQLAVSTDDWLSLYKEVFKEEPQLSGENWGDFPIEKVIDALAFKRPIREKPMPDSRVA
jgi:hypothetical protein